MTSFGLNEQDLRYLTNLPALFPAIERIAIFGSRAKGTFRPGSDIDLALWGKALSADDIATIDFYLHGLPTLYKFDVVHYDTLGHAGLKDHIDRVSKNLYVREKERA